MEDMAAFDTSTIAKDYSGGSGSVLTDHDEAFADYACDHGAIPSPAAFMRAGPELPSSSPRAAAASSSHHKKSGNSVRRSVKKKVVSVPIAEIESIKGGGGDCTPPPDAWTWRKYGQKPIKGSPYPRGYYRCSSSKGCPARKQVERSRVDPSMIVVTYASDHNHTMPAPRGNVNQNRNRPAPESAVVAPKEEKDEHPSAPPNALAVAGSSSPEESTFTLGGDEPPFMTIGGQFYWFSGLVETPLPSVVTFMDDDDDGGAGMFPAAACGEDDALFAELGELPECSVVFRRPAAEAGDERRCNLRRGYGSDEVMIK